MKHFLYVLSVPFLLFVFFSCSIKQEQSNTTMQDSLQQKTPLQILPVGKQISRKDDLVQWLDSLEREYEQACFAMGTANWNNYSKEGAANLDEAKKKFAQIFLNEDSRKIISEWKPKITPNVDATLARRMEMWNRCFIGGAIYSDSSIAALENLLQKTITDFHFTFDGKPITRAQMQTHLKVEKNPKRRMQLWMVSSQLSEKIKNDLRTLVKLRNEKAQQFGFTNYYSLSLYLNAIDEAWLLQTLNELTEQTNEMFQKFVRMTKKNILQNANKDVGPWDFDFALRDAVSLSDKYFPKESVFETLHRFEQSLGFPTDSLPIKEVVKDIPYGGLSLALNIPKDSRFLVNPTTGKSFYQTAFHEYGHSLHAVYTSDSVPILKGYEWIPGAQCAAFAEGMADVHGEFTDIQSWLEIYTKAKDSEIQNYGAGRYLPALYRLRSLMKNLFIEYAMYNHPEQNIDSVERAMFKKYLLVDLDSLATETNVKQFPSTFAASIWYTSYPCYYQNYILSGMIATQIHEAMENKFGNNYTTNPNISSWLIESFYTQGEILEWNEKIRNATGKGLETGAYLRKLGAIK